MTEQVRLFAVVCLFLLVGCSGTGEIVDSAAEPKESIAFVTRVTDGDSIVIRRPIKCVVGGKVRQITSVRYIGVDALERDEPFYKAARALNKDMVYNKQVTLVFDKKKVDSYRRLLAYVYVRNPPAKRRKAVTSDVELDIRNSVNAELLRRGYARASEIKPNTKHAAVFKELEAQAKEGKLGIWSIAVPEKIEEPQAGEYKYIASKSGAVFHKLSCSSAKRISEENRVYFHTFKEAEESGRRPCKMCKPKDILDDI